MTEAPLLPDLSTLPNVEEIAQLTAWLAEAGLSAMELSNASGGKLRIAVAHSHAPVAVPQPLPAPDTCTVTAPYFGRLALCPPLGQEPFAPIGARVCKGDTIALLTLDTLQIPVTAPVDGTVVEVLAQDDTLVGYGAGIFIIRP